MANNGDTGITIYSNIICPFAQRARIVALLKKIENVKIVEVDLRVKPEWFLKISETGKVPLVDYHGKLIWESAILMEFFDELSNENGKLLGDDPVTRAQNRIWIDFINNQIIPKFYKVMWATSAEDLKEKAISFEESIKKFEDAISEHGPYFGGDKISLVDIAVAPWFERLPAITHYLGYDLPKSYTKVHRLIRAIFDNPTYKVSQTATVEQIVEGYGSYIKWKPTKSA